MDNINSLHIKSLEIKNFRCFKSKTLYFDNSLILIQGMNGKGKTSLLEALYYAGYLRSFKNYTPKDLIYFDADNFFIKIEIEEISNNESFNHTLQVGFSGAKRLVKINQKVISSYKELVNHYRLVCLTEDDLALIKEGPKIRRFFIDQALMVTDPVLNSAFKELRTLVEQRNKFIILRQTDREEYYVWTQQLWQLSSIIQKKREDLLLELENQVNNLLQTFFDPDSSVIFSYQRKKMIADQTFELFFQSYPHLYENEIRYGRSLFGAHLDDFVITFQNKKSKDFSSRGQQKLVIVLMKIAQTNLLAQSKGGVILLLDDFMTDFDAIRIKILLDILITTKAHIILTSPLSEGNLDTYIRSLGAQIIHIE